MRPATGTVTPEATLLIAIGTVTPEATLFKTIGITTPDATLPIAVLNTTPLCTPTIVTSDAGPPPPPPPPETTATGNGSCDETGIVVFPVPRNRTSDIPNLITARAWKRGVSESAIAVRLRSSALCCSGRRSAPCAPLSRGWGQFCPEFGRFARYPARELTKASRCGIIVQG